MYKILQRNYLSHILNIKAGVTVEIYSFWGQLGGIAALVITLFYLHNQNVSDRRAMDARHEENKRSSDDRWAALKSETDQRWADLQKQWVEGQKEIAALMRRINLLG